MLMKKYNSNASQPRLETHQGTEYLVVPVVMARAGVEMNGGVISEDDLHAASWNGVPVTVGHPKDSSGNDISANQSPQTLEQWQVGTIFNAKVENGKLKAEAWVNTEKADPDLVQRLQAMDSMDVSTGYFSDIQGNQYTDIKPDHLALLPNEQGACSYNEGCGVRANKMSGKDIINNIKRFLSMDTDKISDDLRMYLNEKGYKHVMRELQSQLDEMDGEDIMHYLVDVFEDDFIYKVDSKDGSKYYRRGYNVDDNENVSMADSITEVNKKIEYEPVTNTKGVNMIDELISNEASPFTEDDKDSLEAMSECTLKSLSEKYEDQEDTDAPETQDDKEETEQSVLSNEDKEALAEAKEIVKQKREEYITHITANSSFEQDSLKEKSTKDLKELVTNINPTANFAGRAMGQPKANGKSNEDAIKAMQTPSTAEIIKNKREVN